MQEYAIIVAGGSGTRMGTDLPKQFLPLAGKPILFHTIDQFRASNPDILIILGLPSRDIQYWNELCAEHSYSSEGIRVVEGGRTRHQTVKNCLGTIEESGLVAVHDGVRPLIKVATIRASFDIASLHKSAVAAVRLKESIRTTTKDGTEAVDRSKYRMIQTPQTFDVELLKKAYELDEEDWMTDDASVVEHTGHVISLFEGDYENIKITTPSDLLIAEALIAARK